MKRLLFCILMMSAGPLLAQAPRAVTLRPGDVLRITVLRHPELSGEFLLDANGTLIHPVYRALRVSATPMEEIEERVRTLLSRFENHPEFVLDPLIQVAVGGEVRQPNLYALRPTTTVAQAVALAGGATERARLERVRLFRDGSELQVDLSRPETGLARDVVRSGDQIVLERRGSFFRDYLAPTGSIVAALAAVLNIVLR